MEITTERVLLVNSLIQTISELYEHDRENDHSGLLERCSRMTAATRDPCDGGTDMSRSAHRDAADAAEPVLAGAAGGEHRAAPPPS